MTEHIFISYKSQEHQFTLDLGADLRNRGIKIWLDRLDIKPGDNWQREIDKGLKNSAALIAVMTKDYFGSEICMQELDHARRVNIPVFPILLRDFDFNLMPSWLMDRQYQDFKGFLDTKSYQSSFERLMEGIKKHLPHMVGDEPEAEIKYLTSLIADLEKWQGIENYITHAAETKQYTDLVQKRIDPSLELMVSKKIVRKRFKIDTIPISNIQEAVAKLNRFVLIGNPGAGKTTTLRRLALDMARTRLGWINADKLGTVPPIPHMVYLPRWQDEKTPFNFINSQWTLSGNLQRDLQLGHVWLYLDGLNEMGGTSGDKIEALRDWLNQHDGPQHVMITCHKDNTLNPKMRDVKQSTVFVCELNNNQIIQFTEKYLLDDQIQPFIRQIFPDHEQQQSFIHLARNPYTLAALLAVFEYQGDLPTNTGALFHALAQCLWERERQRNTPGWIDFDLMRKRFGQLAFDMIDTNQYLDVSVAYALERILDEELLNAGKSAGFIQLNNDKICFTHQLMLEYFAATGLYHVGIKATIPKPEFIVLIRVRVSQKWDQVAIKLCGFVENTDFVVEAVSFSDPLLAIKAIEDGVIVSQSTLDTVVMNSANLFNKSDATRFIANMIKQFGNRAFTGLKQHLLQEEGSHSDVLILLDKMNGTDFDLLIKLINHQNEDIRFVTNYILRRYGEQAIPYLVARINDGDPSMITSVAATLEHIGMSLAIPYLIHALTHQDNVGAAEILGYTEDIQAHFYLIQALKAPNKHIRRIAAKALGWQENPLAVSGVIQSLNDQDSTVRYHAAETLGRIGDPQSIPPLIQSLGDQDEVVRRAAAQALGEIGNSQAVPTLIDVLNDEASDIRAIAAYALGEIGDQQAVPYLIQAFNNTKGNIHSSAAYALGKIGDSRAVPHLIEALKNGEDHAARALGEIGDSRAVPHLIEALKNGEDYAARALGEIGDSQAVPYLIEALKNGVICGDASKALKAIGTVAVPQVIEALSNEDKDRYRSSFLTGILVEIVNPQVLGHLMQATNSSNILTRSAAARALGKIDNPQTISRLVELSSDENKLVRQSVAEALGEIGNPQTIPQLAELLNDEDKYVRESAAEALGKIDDPKIVTLLIQALSDKNSYVCNIAVQALGKIGDSQAVPHLIHVLDIPHYETAKSAAEALRKIGTPEALEAAYEWEESLL